MKKSELRQLIKQVIKEQIANPKDKFLKPKKDLKPDPRIKIPKPIDAQPKSASSGCHPNARKVKLENCFNGFKAIFGCATVNGGQVPIVGQMIDATSFTIGGTVPRQITSVEDANPGQSGNLDLTLYPDQTATECGYDCGGEEANYNCQFNGDGTAEFSTLQSCVNSCVPPNPCKDIMNNTMVDINNNLILPGEVYDENNTSVPGGMVTVGYCRACNQGSFTSGYYTNNPEEHNQLMNMPSPSPNFATNQDVCDEMQANGCCGGF